MFTISPDIALVLAHERAGRFLYEAAPQPLRAAQARRALASFLRRAADLLEPSARLVHRPA